MSCPQIEDGGTASNMEGNCEYINKQSGTADRGWSFSLGVGRGVDHSSQLKIAMLRKFQNYVESGLNRDE